jgi:hypothetical protein
MRTDIKTVFSNGVEASHITCLQQWLNDNGSVVAETKERVLAHLHHHGVHASYCLSFSKTRWVLPAGCDMQLGQA